MFKRHTQKKTLLRPSRRVPRHVRTVPRATRYSALLVKLHRTGSEIMPAVGRVPGGLSRDL